jgi:hypothetical protein
MYFLLLNIPSTMSTSQEDTCLPLNIVEAEQQQADIQDRHQHQTEMQEAAEGNTTTPTQKIRTPCSISGYMVYMCMDNK